MTDILEAVSAHLLGQGIARDPDDTSTTLPPLWLNPREGVPAPVEGAVAAETGPDTVLAAYYSGEIPPSDGEGYSRRDTVDFRVRTRLASQIQPLVVTLKDQFAPPVYGFRSDWTMGGLYVLISRQWRGLAPLGSDELGFDWTVSFLFETFVS